MLSRPTVPLKLVVTILNLLWISSVLVWLLIINWTLISYFKHLWSGQLKMLSFSQELVLFPLKFKTLFFELFIQSSLIIVLPSTQWLIELKLIDLNAALANPSNNCLKLLLGTSSWKIRLVCSEVLDYPLCGWGYFRGSWVLSLECSFLIFLNL